MSKNNHPIEQEELMAYLDGELATNRAVAAAAHLEHCAECQELAAELRKLAQEMLAWEVEVLEAPEVAGEIATELNKPGNEPKKRNAHARPWSILFTPRKLAWAGAVAAALFFIGVLMTRQLSVVPSLEGRKADDAIVAHLMPGTRDTLQGAKKAARSSAWDYTSENRISGVLEGIAQASPAETSSQDDEDNVDSKPEIPTVPMIARTAGLILTTQEFDKSRASLEEILKRHNGYLGELKVSAPADGGRTLTATLRVPGPQLEATMAELKKLGRVEDESQGGEEVTQQYVDLEARLANGKHTEQRLTEILRTRTGKLQDVLKVELEIDRVRGEIEQMQAEKKELTKRVAFATLNTTVKEEYRAKLQATPPSTGSRFRNAAVDGYNTVVEGLIDVGLFLLSSGPSLLIWAAVLFFPVRWLWRKVRAELKKDEAPNAS